MKAVVAMRGEEGCVDLLEVPDPVCDRDAVIARVEAAGICGSDVHIWHGNVSWEMTYPVILGHEFSGVVTEVGDDITAFRVGDRVVCETAARIDTSDEWYRIGAYNLDPNRLGFGARVDGGMAEYVAVPERCLHRLPEGVSFRQGALVEPTCVAYQATCVRAEIEPGDTVVVVGAGTIGLLSAWLAIRSGADNVTVVGLPADSRRKDTVRAFGSIEFVDSVEAAWVLLEGRASLGADVTIDAAGTSAALMTALELTRPNGQLTKVGWGPEPFGASLDPIVAKQLTVRGSFSHTWAVWERVLSMMTRGAGDVVEQVVGWEGSIEDWETGFGLQSEGEVVKGLLCPQTEE